MVGVAVAGGGRREPSCCWRFLEEYINAVRAAPVAALAAAIIATVALDMIAICTLFFIPTALVRISNERQDGGTKALAQRAGMSKHRWLGRCIQL